MTSPSPLFYREIPLTQGQVAVVDLSDFEAMSQYKWQARKSKHSHVWYAIRSVGSKPNQKTLQMHRIIMDLPSTNGLFVDHINGDGLDNRRINLRVATHSQNHMNERLRKDNTSGFKGVSKQGNLWQVNMASNGRMVYVGLYKSLEEACEARRLAEIEMYGEFARKL